MRKRMVGSEIRELTNSYKYLKRHDITFYSTYSLRKFTASLNNLPKEIPLKIVLKPWRAIYKT